MIVKIQDYHNCIVEDNVEGLQKLWDMGERFDDKGDYRTVVAIPHAKICLSPNGLFHLLHEEYILLLIAKISCS